MSSSGFSATSGSRLFWIIRNAASCGHARQCSSVPRGARTVRVAMLMTSILLLGHLAASGSVGLAEESRIERVAHRVAEQVCREHDRRDDEPGEHREPPGDPYIAARAG